MKFIEPVTTPEGRRKEYYRYTAIDDCTRLRLLRIYDKHDPKAAIAFMDDVLSLPPFQVEKVQTDNGAKFQSGFHWHLLDQSINHV